MKINQAEFVKSVARLDQLPKDGLPQIAFAGRSNVGKSSLLNKLFNRKNLALVSASPGKTRLLNFYRVNNSCYFVDLPGYGFAKVSKAQQESWRRLIEAYLSRSADLRGVVVLTDIRLEVQQSDRQMLEWLRSLGTPFVVVGTKADKLSRMQLQRRIKENLEALADLNVSEILPFSALTGEGRAELLAVIGRLIRPQEAEP